MKVGFISLGCSKNLVDTEKAIALFKENNYEIVNNQEEAEIIVVNTCGFIESAKEEAISTILEMAEYKKKKCKYLIVMGCLAQRYKEELQKIMPEVDLYIKYSEYDSFWKQVSELIEKDNVQKKEYNLYDYTNRIITTGNHYAYLKIADGCSNRCTYCAIPYIRGPQVSRTIEDVLEEANRLAEKGYKEIILIAQDTTKYGTDIYGEPKLAELLTKLTKIEKIQWIRFLYAYPETITDELIKIVKENKKICKYFDIPIQHISDSVLKRMNRKSNGKSIRELIQKLRKEIPEVVIRTTVMVGFPGETQEDFEELYHFMEQAKFDKLGCFAYSKEEGTPAEKIKQQVHPMTKKSRYRKIMELQQKISKQNLENQIGKEVEVLIEDISFDQQYYIGRSDKDVPEIDGQVYIKNKNNTLKIGEFAKVKVIEVLDYDLICEQIL